MDVKGKQLLKFIKSVQYIGCIFVLFSIGVNFSHAENSNNIQIYQDEKSYRDSVRLLYAKEVSQAYPQYGLSILNGKKELWKISTLNNGKQIIEIESYDNGVFYREMYFSTNGVLLYAIDSYRYIKNNSLQNSIWECEFFIKNKRIYSEMSIGHGKTERDDWNSDIIFNMF